MDRPDKNKKTQIEFIFTRKGESIHKSVRFETDEHVIDSRETFEVMHNALFAIIEAYKKEYDLR